MRDWYIMGKEEHAADGPGAVASCIEKPAFEDTARRNYSLSIGGSRWGLRVNPFTFTASVLLVWGFTLWCMIEPSKTLRDLTRAQLWVTQKLTWLFMAVMQSWLVILAVIAFKFGHLKLGKPTDRPDFPASSWFMMMFSSGVGIGLFFFGVSEPVWHYEPCAMTEAAGPQSACRGNRYSHLPDDDRAQWAMNTAFFHWGLHAWAAYVIIGMLLGLLVFRRGLPLTLKTCFHPLLGDKIYGWMGDCIDILSVATTLFGICTSLGLGVQQINTGLNRLDSAIGINHRTQVAIIWVITAIATLSVVAGLRVGIRRMSEVNWILGQFILFVLFFQGKPWYLLNNLVQSIGFYLQWIMQLGTHCDTFQTAPTYTASNGLEVTAQDSDGMRSDPTWMNAWSVFYWCWWISWSPFVGMFMARISRGRTIRTFLLGAMIGPVFYAMVWFATFGGIGLRIERQAANLGIRCALDDLGLPMYSRVFNGTSVPLALPMVEVDGREIWRLSCRGKSDMHFDMLANFPMHRSYWGLSIVSIVLYFITSSNTASLVIDCLTANGNPNPPVWQRIFWSATEGAMAMALVLAGGVDSLTSLQAVSIICGVPYTLIVCCMCKALWLVAAQDHAREHGLPIKQWASWANGLLDVFDPPTYSAAQAKKVALAVVAPWYYAGFAVSWAAGVPGGAYQVIYACMFYAWPALLLGNVGQPGLWAVAWTLYLAFTLHLAFERASLRSKKDIGGDVFSDMVVTVAAYPLVAVQLYDEALATIDALRSEGLPTRAPAQA